MRLNLYEKRHEERAGSAELSSKLRIDKKFTIRIETDRIVFVFWVRSSSFFGLGRLCFLG